MKILKNFSRVAFLLIALFAGTSAFAQQGQGARLTAVERAQLQVDRYAKQLDLTPDQTEKVKAIVLSSVQEMEQMRAVGARPDRAAMQAQTLKRAEEIKAILNPAQQERFTQMLSQQMEKGQNRGQRQGGQRRSNSQRNQ